MAYFHNHLATTSADDSLIIARAPAMVVDSWLSYVACNIAVQ